MSQDKAAFGSLGSHRKGVPWRQGLGLAQDELLLPTATLVASLMGTLKVQEEVKSSCPGRHMGML